MLRTLALAAALTLALALPALAGGLFTVGRDSRDVLEFDPGTGSLTRVFAATIDVGFQNPGGIALRPSDGALFVSSRGSGEIWRYDAATGDVVPPAIKTGLFRPAGIDFDATSALLYFADQSNVDAETADAVKQLAVATGVVTTLGSTNGADFDDVAANGSFVFATDTDGNRVIRFATSGGPGSTVISGLSSPMGITFASPSQLLVADTGTDRVLEYTESGGSWSFSRVVLAASAGVVEPCGLALAPGGALSVTGCQSNDVVEVDLVTLAVTPHVAPGTSGLAGPKDAVWSGATLLVASGIVNAVLYFDGAGDATGVVARGLTTQLDGGFDFSADGATLAIASLSEGEVVEFDADSGALLRTIGAVCFLPTDVSYGPGGDLYVSCLGSNDVVRIDGVSGAVGSFILGGSGGLVAPRSLGFGPNGNLFVASASGEVLEYDGSSGFFLGEFVDDTGNGGGFIDPHGFRFHGGQLFLASAFTDEVKTYDATSGAFLTTLVSGGGLDEPTALDLDAGDLFVASAGDDSVRRYDATTGAFLGVFVASGAGGLDVPVDLAFRPMPEPARMAALAAGALLLGALARRRGRA